VPVSGLQVSADGSTLAIENGPCYVEGSGSFPDRIELLRLADGRARRWRPAGPTIIPSLGSLSSDGRSLAFSNYIGVGTGRAANDGASRIVRASAKNGSLTAAARVIVPGSGTAPYGVESLALSPNGKVLYACSRHAATAAGYHYSAVLAAYRAANGRKIRVLGSWNSDQFTCQLAMAPSGDYALVTGLFTAPDPYAYRVNLSTGKKAPIGRAFTPGRPAVDTDPSIIAW
jgi:Tol biopolymer transport system component